MDFTSTYFLILAVLLVPVFYLVPKGRQWYVLLVASLIFYLFSGWTNIAYVIFATFSAFIVTRLMQKLTDEQKLYIKENAETLSKEEKKAYKQRVKTNEKSLCFFCVILNLGILVFFKVVIKLKECTNVSCFANIIVPLGLSYFTLQTIGYVIDVYRNEVNAESNPLKLLLFVSFFPQMTQGPISDFKQLSSELFKEHNFTYENFSWGFQRVIWGFFKKLVVANLMSPYVTEIFENYEEYTGITLFLGMFVVMLQLYADFSGYMDIVCGLCEILDIKLADNFNSPFFSKSLSEFWRRWHITLGNWLRKYLFYPVSISSLFLKMGKGIRNRGLTYVGKIFPTALASLITFFIIGVWHGIDGRFAVYGLLNGLIIMLSSLLKPSFTMCKEKLHISEDSKAFNLFRIARTFAIVSALEVLSDVGTLKTGAEYFAVMFKGSLKLPSSFNDVLPFMNADLNAVVCGIGLLMMFVFSLIQIKAPVRTYFNRIPFAVRAVILSAVCCVIISFGMKMLIEIDGGFMYANF